MNVPVDIAGPKDQSRSRLTVALLWSVLGHAVAAGVVWQSNGVQLFEMPRAAPPPAQVVHLRTEAPPVAPVITDSAAEPTVVSGVISEMGWQMPEPLPEREEVTEWVELQEAVQENVSDVRVAPESIDSPVEPDHVEPPEVDAVREPTEAIASASSDATPQDLPEVINDYALDKHPDAVVALEDTMTAVVDDVMAMYRAELQRALQRVQSYPRRAQRLNLEGVAHVRFHIDATQGITDAELVESSGHGVLDDAARTLLRSIADLPAFPPELQARQIHALSFEVPIEYRLN